MVTSAEPKPHRRAVLAGVGALASVAVARPTLAVPSRPAPSQPLDRVADLLLTRFPETAVYNGTPGASDGGPSARRMDDWSAAGRAADLAAFREAGSALALNRSPADGPNALPLAVGRAIVANALATAAIPYGRQNPLWFSGHAPYVLAPIAGPHVDTPNVMMAQQSLASAAAVDAWIEKLDDFEPGFAAVRERLLHDEAVGCIPPAVLLRKTIPQIEAFLGGAPEQHPLIADLRARMSAAGLTQDFRTAAEARAISVLERRARPAFARLRDTVVSLVPRARKEDGVWAQRDGAALYAANVRALGDTSYSPAEIHRVGLEECRRISGLMDALLVAQDLRTGSVGERMTAIGLRADLIFQDSDDGRAAALAYARQLVGRAEAFFPRILPQNLVPEAALEVRRVPLATEAGASLAFADPPSLDGHRPGIFWVNLRDMASVTRVTLPTIAYHEAVPGHFTAAAVALHAGDRPLLLKIANFNAANEGWAVYCEKMMAELGAYRDDPWGDLGRLNDELWRAVRLVVDTGLHHFRWTREQSSAFIRQQTGKPDTLVTSEVERYMAWPGQALGYKLGQLKLLAMRDDMRARRGTRFTLPAFHRAVLGAGSLPLDLIQARVRAA